jgi:hypothetical protein
MFSDGHLGTIAPPSNKACPGPPLARVKRVLNDYTLANDLDHQFGDVPIGRAGLPTSH